VFACARAYGQSLSGRIVGDTGSSQSLHPSRQEGVAGSTQQWCARTAHLAVQEGEAHFTAERAQAGIVVWQQNHGVALHTEDLQGVRREWLFYAGEREGWSGLACELAQATNARNAAGIQVGVGGGLTCRLGSAAMAASAPGRSSTALWLMSRDSRLVQAASWRGGGSAAMVL